MIDFTNLPIKKKTYAGANGSKICVVYEDEPYMLKFPGFALRNKELSYANGCISEYIGCHIFASVGIDVQKTLLGVYKKNSQEKIVVACKILRVPVLSFKILPHSKIPSLIRLIMDMGQNWKISKIQSYGKQRFLPKNCSLGFGICSLLMH